MRRVAKLTANMILFLFLLTLMVLPVGTAGFMRVEEKGTVLSSMTIRVPETPEKTDVEEVQIVETTETVEIEDETEDVDYTEGTN